MNLPSRSLAKCWFTGDKKQRELEKAEAQVVEVQAQLAKLQGEMQRKDQEIQYKHQKAVIMFEAVKRQLLGVTAERDALKEALRQLQADPEHDDLNSISTTGQPAGVGGPVSPITTRQAFHLNQSGHPTGL